MTKRGETRELHQVALEALDWDADARIRRVWDLKNQWIPYARANALIRLGEEQLNRPRSPRMPCLLVHAAPNSGKTRLQRHYCALHPNDNNPTGDAIRAEVIGIEIRGPDEGAFYDALLVKLHAPFRIMDHPRKKRHQLMNILERVGTRQLLIDEINMAIAGQALKQKTFLGNLKNLLNELDITLFATGTRRALLAVAVDEQLETRFVKEELAPWSNNTDFRMLLESFEARLPLRQASELQDPRMATLIHGLSEGYLGEAAELVMHAAVKAIKTRAERIDLKILKGLNWRLPSQRRAEARGVVANSSKAA